MLDKQPLHLGALMFLEVLYRLHFQSWFERAFTTFGSDVSLPLSLCLVA